MHRQEEITLVSEYSEGLSLPTLIKPASFCQIFVLSAISPEKMPAALLNVARVLKPGGHVLLRDYADGDLAQVGPYVFLV